jgi:transposase
MKAYSEDLRRRVVAAVDDGMPRAEVARLFRVAAPPIKRWLR